MTVVSLIDYLPLPRYDNVPWTKAIIQEGAIEDGPFNTIETITFVDPDVDPKNPKIRSLTTNDATFAQGWYRVIFQDGANNQQAPTAPILNAPGLADSYLPMISDVGALLRARTKDTNGNEVGTFTPDTRPTDDEVLLLIDQAASDVTSLIDYDIPVETYTQAKDVITLGAAMRVELSYFPEAIGADKSAYIYYRDMYRESLERLLAAVERESMEDISGEGPMLGQVPAYGFPAAEGLWTKMM
jgi:hypothetical protein